MAGGRPGATYQWRSPSDSGPRSRVRDHLNRSVRPRSRPIGDQARIDRAVVRADHSIERDQRSDAGPPSASNRPYLIDAPQRGPVHMLGCPAPQSRASPVQRPAAKRCRQAIRHSHCHVVTSSGGSWQAAVFDLPGGTHRRRILCVLSLFAKSGRFAGYPTVRCAQKKVANARASRWQAVHRDAVLNHYPACHPVFGAPLSESRQRGRRSPHRSRRAAGPRSPRRGSLRRRPALLYARSPSVRW